MHDNRLATRRRQVVGPGSEAPHGACLVGGCPCKDARIVSHRRAAFFAAVAIEHGETADRTIAPDPAWRLPTVAA